MEMPSLMVSIAGMPKTGKSHLMLTFPEPIYVISLDLGIDIVLKKFPSKQIDVKTYPIPIIDTLRPKPYARAIMGQLVKDYLAAVESGKYKTIGIDTATNLYGLERQAYAEELGQATIVQFQYGEVYARLSGKYNRARIAGMNLVLTHYLRDRYVNNASTGELELDGWRGTEAMVDVSLWTRREKRTIDRGEKKTVVVTTVKDNRFDLALNDAEFDNLDYETLLAMLMG